MKNSLFIKASAVASYLTFFLR